MSSDDVSVSVTPRGERKKTVELEGFVFPREVWLSEVDSEGVVDVGGAGEGIVELLVQVKDYSVENDGIGTYECHGYKGYDRGVDYVVVEDIKVDASVIDAEGGGAMDPSIAARCRDLFMRAWSEGLVSVSVEEVPGKPDRYYDEEDYGSDDRYDRYREERDDDGDV